MSRERKPRCDRCNRRWTKDSKEVRLRWLDLDEHRCVCPDCQTGEEQLRNALVKNLIDFDKVDALKAAGRFPEREEDFDPRILMRDDLSQDAVDTAGLMLLDLDGDDLCKRCGEVEATRGNDGVATFCERCSKTLTDAAILDLEDEGVIEVDGDEVRFTGDADELIERLRARTEEMT